MVTNRSRSPRALGAQVATQPTPKFEDLYKKIEKTKQGDRALLTRELMPHFKKVEHLEKIGKLFDTGHPIQFVIRTNKMLLS